MPRIKAGEVSRRLKAKAIKVLAATIDDPDVPTYVKAMAARSLLAQPKPEPKDEAEDEFPSGNGGRVVILREGEVYDEALHNPDGKVGIVLPSKIVILPDNRRENIAQERERQRLDSWRNCRSPTIMMSPSRWSRFLPRRRRESRLAGNACG
jgi:hypothetical protein